MNDHPKEITALFIIFLLVSLLILLAVAIRRLICFFRELRFMKIEIERTDGEEREYWLRQRKRLLLSLISFGNRRI